MNPDTTTFTVSPFAVEAAATVEVRINGGSYISVPNGGTSALLPLNPGSNPIEILVTAPNRTTTRLYTLTAFRTLPGSPGEVDFLNASVSGFTMNATVVDPEGRTFLAGNFSSVLGTPRSHIARLLADSTLDPGFNPQASGGDVVSVAVQPDGKVILGGDFSFVNGVPRNRFVRIK